MIKPLVFCLLLLTSVALSVASVAASVAASALEEGLTLFRSGDYERAKEKLEAYLAAHPDDPTALYHLGLAEKDGLKSNYYFERLVETHPDDPAADRALFEIGQFYYANPRNRYGLARQHFQDLLRDYPHSDLVPQAHYRLGLIHLTGGAYDSARAEFRKAIQTDAKSEVTPLARASIAESYLPEGRPDLAVREAEAARTQKGMEPVASRLLRVAAEGHAQIGHRAQADSLRTLIVTRFPDSDDAYRVEQERQKPDRSTTQSPDSSGNKVRPSAQVERPLPPSKPRYLVQIGMFGHTAKAQALLDRLRSAGFNVHDETRKIRGNNLWIFTSGPYDDPDEARRIADDIDRREHLGCRVKEIAN